MELSNPMNLRLSLITAAILPLFGAPLIAHADDSDLEKIVVTGQPSICSTDVRLAKAITGQGLRATIPIRWRVKDYRALSEAASAPAQQSLF